MIDALELKGKDRDELIEIALNLGTDDLPQLIEWLAEKDDALRYQALQVLEQRSLLKDDVYPFWDEFRRKLTSDNSYQRSIGLLLIADNAQWDHAKRLDEMIGEYLLLLHDEKPITVRQCLQALCRITVHKPQLGQIIASSVIAIDLAECRETMRKSILVDILTILATIRRQQTSDQIEAYIADALSGGLLDKKARRQIEALFS